MTPDGINREIAEKVMGWTLTEVSDALVWCSRHTDSLGYSFFRPEMSPKDWSPYTRIDHAWMVVEKMADKYHWSIRTPFFKGEPYFAGLTPCGVTGWNGRPDFEAHAVTAPAAICLAALKTVEVKDER